MELKMEDLMPECKECQGKGQISNPASNQVRGIGVRARIDADPAFVTCSACRGKGVVLTDSGKTLLEFMRRAKDKMFL